MRDARRRRQQQATIGLGFIAALAAVAPRLVHGEGVGEAAKPSTKPSTAGEPAEVLATFEGGRIIRADYERVVAQKTPREREFIDKPGGREALLEKLIRYDLIALEAERRGYGQHLDVKIAERHTASEQMLAALFTVDREKIPAEELQRAYEKHKGEYGRPHMRRGTQIRVATEDEAKTLIAQLRGKDREEFTKVSREKNIDPRTRNQGGELGFFDREAKTESGRPTEVPLELVQATFALKRIGDITPKPIAEGGSFNVVMFTGEMEPVTKSIAELDPILREQIAKSTEERSVEALAAELKAKTPIEIHPELIDAIELPRNQPLDIPEGFAAAPSDPRAPPIMLEPDGI